MEKIEWRVYRHSLYYLHNFSVNIKLFQNKFKFCFYFFLLNVLFKIVFYCLCYYNCPHFSPLCSPSRRAWNKLVRSIPFFLTTSVRLCYAFVIYWNSFVTGSWNAPTSWLLFKNLHTTLAGVAQQIEHWPVNQRVTGLIPSQGTRLGCGPGSQLGVCKRQTHWHFSPSLSPFLPLSRQINK